MRLGRERRLIVVEPELIQTALMPTRITPISEWDDPDHLSPDDVAASRLRLREQIRRRHGDEPGARV
jgi:hypothetical protein